MSDKSACPLNTNTNEHHPSVDTLPTGREMSLSDRLHSTTPAVCNPTKPSTSDTCRNGAAKQGYAIALSGDQFNERLASKCNASR